MSHRHKLASNVMRFARLLRDAGLPVGTGKILLAVEAMSAIDITRRQDVYWALHAVCVEKHSQSEMFSLAFERFWTATVPRNDDFDPLADGMDESSSSPPDALPKRLAEALAQSGLASKEDMTSLEFDIDGSNTWSGGELLRSKDFETMSAEEENAVRKVMQRIRLPIPELRTRRMRRHPAGRRIDMRATLRATVRAPDLIELQRKRRIKRQPPLVVLCDISGSMETYSRMLLYFLHAVTNDRDRVHTFLFGTRLTNISKHLAHRDPDVAIARVSKAVEDWSGGTRIGETLAVFNRQWSRRVLGQGAIVLLITDGLDRDGGAGLAQEMNRLQKSCRRLIWLNPLLRYDQFEPRSAGIREMLPYVDEFRPAHNVESFAALAQALAASDRTLNGPHFMDK